jgi:phosphatidylglycerol---prolipoprotein diacylglyceryl transferase
MPGINIGPITITYYGIILMSGALAGACLAAWQAKQRGLDTEFVWDGLVWVLVGGIIGARIWHILTPPPSMVAQGITTAYYLTHPLDAINTRLGGLGIPGAVIGGLLALYIFCRARKVSFSMWVDIIAPCLALGQAIGRWGNFVNQELYGSPSTLPWAITIDVAHRLPQYKDIATYHPLVLYESLFSLANMAFLLWIGKRYTNFLKSGDVFLIYLVTYPIARFFLDYLRLDASEIAGINANQTVMAIVAFSAAIAFYMRHRDNQKTNNDLEEEL